MKTVRYTDPLHDDFAGNSIRTKPVTKGFRFAPDSRLWRVRSALVYYLIALPIVWVVSKVYLGVRFKNRRALRKLPRGQGFFLYGNHTRALDAFVPPLAAFPRKAYTVANSDVVSIPGLRRLVQLLGALPLPTELGAMPEFMAAMARRFREKSCIAIYPEAHIWPFYTGIRPFQSASFRYPVRAGAPVIAMVTTYRRRRGLFRLCRRPGMTVTLSDPMTADPSLSLRAAAEDLRARAYAFMLHVSQTEENVEYIRYEQSCADSAAAEE